MSAASRAVGFRAHHQPASVHARAHGVRDRLPEAGPASTAVELRLGREEVTSAAHASKDPGAMLVVQGTGERPFSGLATQHTVLRRRQPATPFLVAPRDRERSADCCRRRGEPADDRHQPAGAGKDYEELPPAFHQSIVTPDRSDAATDVPPGSLDRRPPPAARTLANDRAGAGASAHGPRRNPSPQAASGPDASSRKCARPARTIPIASAGCGCSRPPPTSLAEPRSHPAAPSAPCAPVRAAPAVRPVRRPTGSAARAAARPSRRDAARRRPPRVSTRRVESSRGPGRQARRAVDTAARDGDGRNKPVRSDFRWSVRRALRSSVRGRCLSVRTLSRGSVRGVCRGSMRSSQRVSVRQTANRAARTTG